MLSIEIPERMNHTKNLSGSRVVVIGAARQGIALANYLLNAGAEVVLNDRQPSDQLIDVRKELSGKPIEWVLGGHPFSILEAADLVCISGGVPFNLPVVEEARRLGIEVSNDSQIFLDVCPCRVIGITGSAGKTTTTTLVGLMAQAAVEQTEVGSRLSNSEDGNFSEKDILTIDSRVWVGGNIGNPLLSMVDQMGSGDLAVMELSSFQLEVMHSSPQIAAILNITPNHLDRHKSMEAYSAAKARILWGQTEDDIAILNLDDPNCASLADKVHGRLKVFSLHGLGNYQSGAFLNADSGWIIGRDAANGERRIVHRSQIPLRGEHNVQNVVAACAIATSAGISTAAMVSGIKNFQGIPHRLEFVRTWQGGDWYNDSIATAPERTVAALNSFAEPIILLAGGRDKDLPWDSFAAAVSSRGKHLILFGEAAQKILEEMKTYLGEIDLPVTICEGLQEAVTEAAKQVEQGDVVLLSPGGTSFDQFRDFEARGEAYKKWVMELP